MSARRSLRIAAVQPYEPAAAPLAAFEPNYLRGALSAAAETTTHLRAAQSIALWPGQEIAGRAGPTQDTDWETPLELLEKRSFFHTRAWVRVLERTYGFTPRYFTIYEGNCPVSMLPVIEVNSWLTGRRAIALPFTDSCEPLYRDIQSGKELIEAIIAFGKRRGWNSVEIRGGDELFEGSPASLSFHEHVLHLDTSEDRQFGRLNASVRRAIRKAQRAGVTCQVSQTWEAMRRYYSLHCKTRRRHGLPPQSFAFFEKIYEEVLSQNLGAVVLAFYQGVPIAGNVYFRCGDRAIYKFGASNQEFQHLRGSNLAMWEGIKWLARSGSEVLNFGRTSRTNQGLRKFKLGWGALEKPLRYFKFDCRTGRFVADSERTTGCYNRVFRILPLFLSRSLGGALYRHAA